MPENDLRPVAKMLLKQFGNEAKSLAAKRAKELLDQGSQEGGLFWIQIVRAIVDVCPFPTRENRQQRSMDS
jgi:hypothetical protein